MQGIYWRPRSVSRIQLLGVAALAAAALVAIETLPIQQRLEHYDEKVAAAQLAQTAMEVVKAERLRRGMTIDPESDPAATGLIGSVISPLTSGAGALASKQTTANPNLAAVIVEWLRELQLRRGDRVAIGVSGSFPGANIAVYSAVHSLGLSPVIISSVAASQWGANLPGFSWVEMEAVLNQREIFPFRSIAVSRGGIGDRGLGMSKEGRELLDAVMNATGLEQLRPRTPEESIEQRMQIYRQASEDSPIVAYINVGGGTVSVGTKVGKKNFRPGVNRRAPRAATQMPSVMGSFIKSGVPVIHVTKMAHIAERYGLPVAPLTTPKVGQGGIFVQQQYNRPMASLALLLILAAMWGIFRMPRAERLLSRGGDDDQPKATVTTP